ncbi:hypothetical protein E4U14_005434 [Claviceps sp. LM454 group G7]|nr:hypothetical protein E4U14_005434 [Claviceps sp. LM454 group G7]
MQQGQPPPGPFGRSQSRGPGSFSPLPINPSRKLSTGPRPPPLQTDVSGYQDVLEDPSVTIAQLRRRPESPATPIYNQFSTTHANTSSSSVQQHQKHHHHHHHHQQQQQHQNFSRPAPGATSRFTAPSLSPPLLKSSSRKHSATQGLFDSTLPSTSTSNLSQVSMNTTAGAAAMAAVAAAASANSALSASQMAAQAAVMSHQNGSHARQRSQTVPITSDSGSDAIRRGSGSKMPMGPPTLSLTEASAPRESAIAGTGGGPPYDRSAGWHSSAATAAANVVFPRSGHTSPRMEKPTSPLPFPPVPALPVPPPVPEKSKTEKTKHKLFSRTGKSSSSKAEGKEKSHQSPGKIGTALSALQRGNFSTTSLVEPPTAPSMYSLNNSSSATIRPMDMLSEERAKEKEKKHHHFLSRQKQKLKDEYHLPLSSASSNSRPTDPNAPSSLYNFNVPPSPGHGSSTFSIVKKDKKLAAERSDSRAVDVESSFGFSGERYGVGGLSSLSQQQSNIFDPSDAAKVATQHSVALDEAWPYLKTKLLVVFEGEDLRLPVEDINRIVQSHIQRCIHKRCPSAILEDLRDLLANGFSILDRTLRLTPEDRVIPVLVELWLFTFTTILPYMQSVFLPLELEVSGCGVLLTPEQARDFWGGASAALSPSGNKAKPPMRGAAAASAAPVGATASILDVRRLVLTAYRDIVVLPRYETLKTIFSRLSLEFLPSSFASTGMGTCPAMDHALSPSPSEAQSSMARPGTAMSSDPPVVGSYNSSSTTYLGDGSEMGRSRAVSNVSFGSHGSAEGPGVIRPYTPSSAGLAGLSRVREQNVEDSKQVTDMVGRMLQCMSVLSSIGGGGAGFVDDDEGSKRIEELSKMLKLNWLGRGRTGRNRRGIVGGRVRTLRREEVKEEVRVA